MDNKLLVLLVNKLVHEEINKIELREGPKGPRGLKGRDGNDFRIYDHTDAIVSLIKENLPTEINLTEEQISLLKGEPGPKGRDGKDGMDGKDFIFEEHSEFITNKITELCEKLSLKFEDFTSEQIEMLRGPKGRDGLDGQDGKDGKDFVFEDHSEKISEMVETAVPKFEDFTDEQLARIRGQKGRDGRDGRDFHFEDHVEEISQIINKAVPKFEDLTEDQIESLRGQQGQKGESGKDFSFEENREEINNLVISYLSEIRETLTLKFSDLSEDDKAQLRGPRGQRGKAGRDFDLEEATPTITKAVREHIEGIKPELKAKFSDFTDEEKDSLKLKFEHLSTEDRMTLRGPRGQRGKQGQQGEDGGKGKDGIDGKNGKMGPRGLPGLSGKNGRDGRDGQDGRDGRDAPVIVDVDVESTKKDFKLLFEFEDGRVVETPSIKLPKGDTTFYYPAGISGGGGSGTGGGGTGEDGKSAYELAVEEGFVGTLEEWLDFLKGADGDAGADGKSAFEVAVENGFIGDVTAWLLSLKGSDGDAGADGKSAYESAVENGFVGTEAEWITSLTEHTHALDTLEQSGASENQVPFWNGTAWTPGSVDARWLHPKNGFRLIEHFNATTIVGSTGWTVTTNSGLIGGNATFGSTSRFGLARLETAASATSAPTISYGNGSTFVFGGMKHLFETDIILNNLSTSTEEFIVRIGYSNATTGVLGTNAVMFEYDRATSGNFWRIRTRVGSVDSTTVTSTPVTASTWARLRIMVNATGTLAEFFIDDVKVGEHSTTIPTGTTNLTSPCIQIIKTVGTTTRILLSDWILIGAGQEAGTVTDAEASVLPEGGTEGQVLKKLSGLDYDFDWQDEEIPEGLTPAGGTLGQVLKKNSSTDYDYSWQEESGGGGDDTLNTYYVTNEKSATFNGTTSYVDYGNTFNKERTDAFSISFWMKTTSITTTQSLFSKRTSTGFPGYYLNLESNNRLIFSMGNGTSNNATVRGPTGTFTANVWTHIVITYSGSSTVAGLKIYKDGVLQTLIAVADTLTATTLSSTSLKIGQFNGTFFSGQIDDFTMWNSELDAYDVYELFAYQTRKDLEQHTKYSSLAHHWKLGDGDTTTSLDSVGGVTGTLVGSVTFATDTPFATDTDMENNPSSTYDAIIIQGRNVAITPYGTPTALTTPSSIPGAQGNSAEWSPSGRLLAVGHSAASGANLIIYERIGDTLVKLPNAVYPIVGHCNGVTWSPCERFLYLSVGSPSYMYIYERSGNAFNRLPLPATVPTGIPAGKVAVSPDNRFITYAHLTSPFITTYERGGQFGNTFTKLADPASLPTTDSFSAAYSPDGTLLAVALNNNTVELYSISGSVFTKLSGSLAVGGIASSMSWSPNGKFLSVVIPTSGGIVFRRIGNSLYKMPAYDTPPAGTSFSSAWSPDSKFLYVGHSDAASNYCCVYQLQNDRKFVKQTWTTGLVGNGRGISVSNDGKYIAIAHATSPFLSWFKSSGANPKVDGRRPRIVGPQAIFDTTIPTAGDPTSFFLHPSLGDIQIEKWKTNTTAGSLGWTFTANSGAEGTSAGAFGTVFLSTTTSATAAPTLALSTVGHWNLSSGNFSFETRMSLSAISDATQEYIARVGYHNSATSGTSGTNGMYFEYDRTVSTFWRCIVKSSVTGLTTTVTTSLAFTTAARTFKIHCTPTLITFVVDGVIVAQITTDIPTSNVIPVYNMVKTVGTTDRRMFMYWAVLGTGQGATTL